MSAGGRRKVNGVGTERGFAIFVVLCRSSRIEVQFFAAALGLSPFPSEDVEVSSETSPRRAELANPVCVDPIPFAPDGDTREQ